MNSIENSLFRPMVHFLFKLFVFLMFNLVYAIVGLVLVFFVLFLGDVFVGWFVS